MAQVGSVCNVHNHRSIQNAPVRHSAADTNGTSTQSHHRHGAARYRRRKPPEPETPNGVVLNRSASRSVGDLSFRSADELRFGAVPLRVDTSDTALHQTALIDGCRNMEHCQKSSTDVKHAGGYAAIGLNGTTSGITANTRTSDATVQNHSIRTLSNGATGVSNFLDDENFPATATNGVPVFLSPAVKEKEFDSDARNNNILRPSSANGYRVSGLPAVEYPRLNVDGTSAAGSSDARNENQQIVPRSESDGALAKVGDFDREREIERRMRELGLWDYKREQERHLSNLLEAQISRRDGLTAAIRRGRRRQRGEAASVADDIRCHVNHQFIRYDHL